METRNNKPSKAVYENNALGFSLAISALTSQDNVNIGGCVTGGNYIFDGNSWSRSDGNKLVESDLTLIVQLEASGREIKAGEYDLKGVAGDLISVNGDILAGGITMVQTKINNMGKNKPRNHFMDRLINKLRFLFRK